MDIFYNHCSFDNYSIGCLPTRSQKHSLYFGRSLSRPQSKEKIISQLIKAVLNQFQVAANNNNNDVTEIDFITACPVHECINFKEIYTWKHPNGNCKGKLRLTQEGTIRCTQCSNKWEIVKWEFECPNHKGKQTPTAQGLCHAVNCTSNDIHSIATFAAKCIGAIMSKIENN